MGSQKNINRVMNKIDIHILQVTQGNISQCSCGSNGSGTPCSHKCRRFITNCCKTGWTVDPQNAKELAKSIRKQ